MSIDLNAIRAREAAATPGPWQWYGNTDVRDIYLATRRWGRQYVMRFARYGMSGAQPVFASGRTWEPDPKSMADFDLDFESGSGMVKASTLPIFEVAPNATNRLDPKVYRADLAGIRNPDATFIAHARQDVADLLAEVDRLGNQVQQAQHAHDGLVNLLADGNAITAADLSHLFDALFPKWSETS